jgi:hypothetical protein
MSTKKPESTKKIVTLYSKLDMDTSLSYGDTHIVVAPRGVARDLDRSLLPETLPKGIIEKSEVQ